MTRLVEFFEENRVLSMSRLATFIATIALTIGFFGIMIMLGGATGIDLQQYLNALTTMGMIIAGLGGFNYMTARVSGAYADVKIKQAEQTEETRKRKK